MSNIAYKGFDVNDNNQLQCRDMIYELNKEYTINGELMLCRNGMHFCWDIRDINYYYPFHNSTICEVEILGNIIEDVDEACNKACTNKLKILRIIDKDELMELTNEGIGNIGYLNQGNGNTGDYNIGNNNTGNSNIGDYNTGKLNQGDFNKGFGNKGNHNIGDDNIGNNNKGDRNKGDNNIGNWNMRDNIIGFFNNVTNIGSLDNIALFNKLSNISMEEFKQMDVYKSTKNLNMINNMKSIEQLPNFDKDIFREIISSILKR